MPDFGPAPLLRRGSGPGAGAFRDSIWEGDPVATIDAQVQRDIEAHTAEMVLEDRRRAYEASLKPRLVEAGPMVFTTCVALEHWPSMVYDVNCYYAHMDVSWRATKKEIRRSYQRLSGDRYPRLTYVLKQLLHDGVRAAYDACQPGSVFFDRYLADYVRRQMLDDSRDLQGRSLSLEEQQAQGLADIDLSEFLDQPYDLDKDSCQDQNEPGKLRWRWGYYLWRTEVYDTGMLQQWQEALIRACAERGLIAQLSLGLMGDSAESVAVEQIGYRTVVFLHTDAQPPQYEDLAHRALDRVVIQQ